MNERIINAEGDLEGSTMKRNHKRNKTQYNFNNINTEENKTINTNKPQEVFHIY